MSNAFKLKNETILISTEAPGGIYNASQLKMIASLCDGKIALVRATEDQRIALAVKPEFASEISDKLKSTGLGIRHYQDGLHGATSCIGSLCPDHEQDALSSAIDVTQQLESIELSSPLKIGINGCAKCCTPCHTFDISVIGDTSGYKISIGGKNSLIPEMASFAAEGVPADELPQLLEKVVQVYAKNYSEGESLQSVIERIGTSEFISVLSPYSQDAADSQDPFNQAPAAEVLETAAPETIETAAPSEEIQEEVEAILIEEKPEDLPVELAAESSELAIELDEKLLEHVSQRSSEEVIENDPNASKKEADFFASFEEDSTLDIDPHTSSDEHEFNSEISINSPTDSIPDIEVDEPLEFDKFDDQETLIEETPVEKVAAAPEVLSEPAAVELHEATLVDETENQTENQLEEDFENKISASISEQEKLVDVSQDDDVRNDALEVFSASETSIEDEQPITEEMALEDISSEETETNSFSPEVLEALDPIENHLPLSEIVTFNRADDIDDLDGEVLDEVEDVKSATQFNTNSHQWNIAGIDINPSGSPVLTFANGVAVTISNESLASGSIVIGGQTIKFSESNGGLEVQINGMKMFIPQAA